MISIIITSFKEPHTIGECIRSVGDIKYSGLAPDIDFEIIQVSPDAETLDAGREAANTLGIASKYRQVIDPHKGKPHALNLAFEAAKGEILVLTDGDSKFGEDAVKHLLQPFDDPHIGAVTGHPLSADERDSFWGYQSHMFVEAAHAKRMQILSVEKYDESRDRNFFPMSGYIFAIRKIKNLKLPANCVIDDLHITHLLYDQGYTLAYAPKANAFVKFPRTLQDTIKQKRRNLIGHQVIAEAEDIKSGSAGAATRSLKAELGFALFPISYAKTLKEYFYTARIFAVRAIVWLNIFIYKLRNRNVMGKHGWERIESTK